MQVSKPTYERRHPVQVATIGVDLAKTGFHVHGITADEESVFSYPVSDDDNKVSNKASNKLMGYVRAVRDDPTDRALALHSFRHTFTTICRNAEPTIDWEMRERLLGHGGSETARTYGQAARVANVLREIRRLDFSFLRRSK